MLDKCCKLRSILDNIDFTQNNNDLVVSMALAPGEFKPGAIYTGQRVLLYVKPSYEVCIVFRRRPGHCGLLQTLHSHHRQKTTKRSVHHDGALEQVSISSRPVW